MMVICVTVCQPSKVSLTDANPGMTVGGPEASASEVGAVHAYTDPGLTWEQCGHRCGQTALI